MFFSSDTECEIPKIKNGSFIVLGTESSKVKPIKYGAIVVFKCDLQYELNTEYANITCEKGKWSQTVPKCIRKYFLRSNFPYFFNIRIK